MENILKVDDILYSEFLTKYETFEERQMLSYLFLGWYISKMLENNNISNKENGIIN